MLKMFGIGADACVRCGHRGAQAGDGPAAYCGACGLLLGAPRHKPVLVDNRWVPAADELAVFFGVRELSGIFAKTLRVPATARAYILQDGQATEVPQGEYEIEGFFTRLNNLLRHQHAEILVTRSAALPVEFTLAGLSTCEHLQLEGSLVLSLKIESVPAFARHFMTMPGTVKDAQLRELLASPVRQQAQEFLHARSLREMAGCAGLRQELDQHLQMGLAPLLAEYGLALARVDTVELRHDRFDANRARIGSLWLAADEQRVRVAHARQLDELYDEQEWDRIRRAERAEAVRARQLELYGRIVEARTRKQAIERGAVDAVAALEHELAAKQGARQDEAARWQQLRELAALRLRSELDTARQEAAQARALEVQRFSHQLLQQQISNKIEQARGIEDASRQRSELARLHEAAQAAARREREVEDQQHAARLREAQRALAWQEAQADGHLSLAAEQLRQQVDELRRAGAAKEALAQHEKLMRTIEADRLAARNEREGLREQREHELALLRAELERVQAMGAIDDGTRVALAAPANAALLAEVMKARVHAGMSGEQLAALAGVVGAANVDAWRLGQEQVERERERRDAELERERRHQLALLAGQDGSHQAALANQVRLAAGIAGACTGVLQTCPHRSAHRGDRFCAACGSALTDQA